MITNETFIISYIRGTLSPSEMKEGNLLMKSSAEFAEKVNQIKKTYHLYDNLEAQKSIETEVAWQKLNNKIKRDRTKKIIWNFTRNAAAILLPLFLLQHYVIQPLLKETPQELITLYSAPGIVTKAVLPDGSEVWLNSQSELSYPREFTGKERRVELIGEAYFKVVSDEKNRFQVITPHKMVVSAYGTEFNVNAYKEDLHHSVTLSIGNVDISIDGFSDAKALVPGQKAIVHPMTHNLQIAETDTYVETAWKDGKMVFRREKIQHIAEKLARKFGVVIQLEGNISNENEFTATFTNESLEDILELLKMSGAITYKIKQQKQLENKTFTQREVTITVNKK